MNFNRCLTRNGESKMNSPYNSTIRSQFSSLTRSFLFLVVAISAAFITQPVVAQGIRSIEDLPPFASGPVDFGYGYNQIEDKDSQQIPIQDFQLGMPEAGGEEKYGIFVIDTKESFKKLSELSIKLKGSYGAASGKATYKKKESEEYNSHSVYLVAVSYKVAVTQRIRNGKLVPDALRMLESRMFGELSTQYGSRFISQVKRGGLCFLVYEFECSDVSKKQSLTVAIQAAYGTASGSASRKQVQERLQSTKKETLLVSTFGRLLSESEFPQLDFDSIESFVRKFNSTIKEPVSWTFETRSFAEASGAPLAKVREYERWTQAMRAIRQMNSTRQSWEDAQTEMSSLNPVLVRSSRKELENAKVENKKVMDALSHLEEQLLSSPPDLGLIPQIDKLLKTPLPRDIYLNPVKLNGQLTFKNTPGSSSGDVYSEDFRGPNFGYFLRERPWVPEIRGIRINLAADPSTIYLEYSVQYQRGKGSGTWSQWTKSGETTPVSGSPIVAFRARLRGPLASRYSLRYELVDCRGHYENDRTGWVEGWQESDNTTQGYAGNIDVPNRPGFTALAIEIWPKK